MSAPRHMPEALRSEYTMNGLAEVKDWYFDDVYPPRDMRIYSLQEIAFMTARARMGCVDTYPDVDPFLYQALDAYPVADRVVGVFGSAKPWYESVCLSRRARHVFVLEYGPLLSMHPRVTALSYKEYEQTPILFDAALSISSFEHDGLGRYGDPLSPDGDLRAMADARRMIKPGGLLFLSVPVGRDSVVWNAHRNYGRARLPRLLEGFEHLSSYGFEDRMLDEDNMCGPQPIFVLRRPTTDK